MAHMASKDPVNQRDPSSLREGKIVVASGKRRSRVKNCSGLFIGMDEAGYGPNLGPLLIAATRWKTPVAPQQCDFYQLLADAVAVDGTAEGQKLHIADSKLVNMGRNGFHSLETSALALLHCLGWEVRSFHHLWEKLTGMTAAVDASSLPTAPWYAEELFLPVVAPLEQVCMLAERLTRSLLNTGIELLDVRADLIAEERFNQLVVTNGDNKGLALSRSTFRLLRTTWFPEEESPTLVVGDKHGGRNRYDELLSEVLDGEMIFRIEEGQSHSRYRVQRSELRFQVGGEVHLPVACASIIAKYMRELSMKQFNRFWSRHCPEVKATLGYPNDARRFRHAVEEIRLQLGIAETLFWRSK